MGMLRGFALYVIAIGVLQNTFPAASETSQCTQRKKRCTCVFPGTQGSGNSSSVVVDSAGADSDHRTVGLAAATGALGGLLATGSGLAAYFHFRGNSGGGGGGGSSGGGFGESLDRGGKRDSGWGGGEGGSSDARPASTDSNDSYGSETPLNKRHRGDQSPGDHNRPSSVGSTTSTATTNIYKQSKVWPGRF